MGRWGRGPLRPGPLGALLFAPSGPVPWPLAHSLLPGWPHPPRFSTIWVLGRKGLCFQHLLPASPHPLPGLVTGCTSVAQPGPVLIWPLDGWVEWAAGTVSPPSHPPYLSSRCAFLPIDSFVSDAPSPFISIPLPLPAQLSPDFGFSLLLSPRLLSASPSLPFSLSPAPRCAGVGRALFLPLVSGLGHHSRGSRGRPDPQDPQPQV